MKTFKRTLKTGAAIGLCSCFIFLSACTKEKEQTGSLKQPNPLLSTASAYTGSGYPDLGDAPDTWNHPTNWVYFNIERNTSNPAVYAYYPTVFTQRASGGWLPGPIHYNTTLKYYLGSPTGSVPGISEEEEAETGQDNDGYHNIDVSGSTRYANLDHHDDGLYVNTTKIKDINPREMPFTDCSTGNTFDFKITVTSAGVNEVVYVNMWVDWAADGMWYQTQTCGGGTSVPDYIVKDYQITLPSTPGTYTYTTPAFAAIKAGRHQYFRITLADVPVSSFVNTYSTSEGNGPWSGYDYGETEDYFWWGGDGVEPGSIDPPGWVDPNWADYVWECGG